MHPATFLRVLGPDPWRCAYVQPSRRPADGRYGENPFRLGRHLQLQVVLKPSPEDVQELYLHSLERLGIDRTEHDIRFEEDNWESPTLGAWGVGWQVVMDGMEITQFTYFQQAGGIDLSPISAEITYGLERIAMFLVEGELDLRHPLERDADLRRGAAHRRGRDVEILLRGGRRRADDAPPRPVRARGAALLAAGLVMPAYEATLQCSHLFNVLDARGAVSATDRVGLDPARAQSRLRLREGLPGRAREGRAAGARARRGLSAEQEPAWRRRWRDDDARLSSRDPDGGDPGAGRRDGAAGSRAPRRGGSRRAGARRRVLGVVRDAAAAHPDPPRAAGEARGPVLGSPRPAGLGRLRRRGPPHEGGPRLRASAGDCGGGPRRRRLAARPDGRRAAHDARASRRSRSSPRPCRRPCSR